MAITQRSINQLLQKTKNILANLKSVDPRIIVLAVIPLVVVVVIIFSVVSLISRTSQSSQAQTPTDEVMKPSGTAQINRNFSFSLKGTDGKKVGTFSFTVENAELDKQIIV